MLYRKDLQELSETNIRRLSGGPKRNHHHFIGILPERNSDCIISVVYAKLRNQMGSQLSPSYPRGYEPFLTPYGERSFFLHSFDFPVPTLVMLPGAGRPVVRYPRKPACILHVPELHGATYEVLMREHQRLRWACKIRERSAGEDFQVILALLESSLRKDQGYSAALGDLGACFERLLSYASSDTLRDLANLLTMPSAGPGSTPFARAA